MFNRTTSFIFNKYGEIISELNQHHDKLIESTIRLKEKYIREYMSFDKDVYIQVQQGIVMLVVSMDEDAAEYEKFVIHRIIKVKAGVKFNFISISSTSRVELLYTYGAKKTMIPTFNKVPVTYERKIFAVNIGVQGAVVDEGQFPVIMLFSREDIVGIAHLIVITEDLFHFESRH